MDSPDTAEQKSPLGDQALQVQVSVEPLDVLREEPISNRFVELRTNNGEVIRARDIPENRRLDGNPQDFVIVYHNPFALHTEQDESLETIRRNGFYNIAGRDTFHPIESLVGAGPDTIFFRIPRGWLGKANPDFGGACEGGLALYTELVGEDVNNRSAAQAVFNKIGTFHAKIGAQWFRTRKDSMVMSYIPSDFIIPTDYASLHKSLLGQSTHLTTERQIIEEALARLLIDTREVGSDNALSFVDIRKILDATNYINLILEEESPEWSDSKMNQAAYKIIQRINELQATKKQ